MLFCRATQRRNFNTNNWSNIWQEFSEAIADESFVNELAQHYNAQFKVNITVNALRRRLLKLAEDTRTASKSKNSFLEEFLSHAEVIKGLLLQKPWRVWKADPKVEFVTSDNPVITFVPVGNGQLSPGYGFRFPGVVAAFPLSPSKCLAMGGVSPELCKLDVSGVTAINEVLIRSCDRYVYSKTHTDQIKEMVNEYGGTARYGVTTHLPVGLKLPKVKEFIRRYLGLKPSDGGA